MLCGNAVGKGAGAGLAFLFCFAQPAEIRSSVRRLLLGMPEQLKRGGHKKPQDSYGNASCRKQGATHIRVKTKARKGLGGALTRGGVYAYSPCIA